MTLSTGHVILACLVAMVAAAPTADHRTDGQEAVVSLSGDSGALTRAKRAKEEVVYGNQQNVAKAPASAAKKSVGGGFHFPPLLPSGLLPPDSPPAGPDTFPSFPQHFDNKMDLGAYPYFASKPQRPKGEPDKAGFMYASRQRPIEVNPAVLEETASELQAAAQAPNSGDGGSEGKGEAEKQKESPEQKNTAQSAIDKAGDEKPTAEPVKGKPDDNTPEKSPDAEESEEGGEDSWESSEAQVKAQSAAAAASPSLSEAVESEVQVPQGFGPPLDSRLADAEEALHAKDQAMEKDDMEVFLKELQEPKEISPAGNNDKAVEEEEEDVKDALQEAKEEEEKEEEEKEEGEGSAEAELMGVVDGDAEGAEKSSVAESGDYAKQLLKYILLNGNEYGGVPVSYPGYSSYSSPYYARRRRSLAPRRRELPHIHRRRRSGRRGAAGKPQLTRSKRTKRDLLDDELYYNPDAQYALQEAVEEEEEKQAEMEDLISYLMALYPAIYENQPPPRGSPYPGYMWYGNNYPEEAYPEWEAPEYMEAPFAEWEPPTQPVPAWEPAFYPEEVEEQGYYPAPGKRASRLGRRQFQRRDSTYPYGQEAYWGALVPAPEERVYEDAYQRLQDLATVLGDARQPPVYSLDAFSDYRKK